MTHRQRKDIAQNIRICLPFNDDTVVDPERLLYIQATQVHKILAWCKILEDKKQKG